MRNEFLRLSRGAVNQMRRPRGLAFAGRGATISLPRIVRGRKYISIGHNSHVGSHSWIEGFAEYAGERFTPEIVIGDEVQIGRYATITAITSITIGFGCLLSEYVYISDHTHDVFGFDDTPLVRRSLIPKGAVRIGNFCFLGLRSIVMPGVTLGNRCVVGAGSVVTKSFPDKSVVAGAPARLIRSLNDDQR